MQKDKIQNLGVKALLVINLVLYGIGLIGLYFAPFYTGLAILTLGVTYNIRLLYEAELDEFKTKIRDIIKGWYNR